MKNTSWDIPFMCTHLFKSLLVGLLSHMGTVCNVFKNYELFPKTLNIFIFSLGA